MPFLQHKTYIFDGGTGGGDDGGFDHRALNAVEGWRLMGFVDDDPGQFHRKHKILLRLNNSSISRETGLGVFFLK